jgi:hypothetical protein
MIQMSGVSREVIGGAATKTIIAGWMPFDSVGSSAPCGSGSNDARRTSRRGPAFPARWSPAIDRGELDGVTVGSLVKVAAALAADVDLYLRWRGERLDRLVDEAHAALVDTFVRLLQGLGWIVEVEVSFSIWGERGSIDILAFHPLFGALLIVEIKSVIAASQATLHGLDRKARLARHVIQGRGWDVRHVSRLLVIGATATSRRRVARLAATYDAALPERGAVTRRWLRRPDRPLSGLPFLANDGRGSTRKAPVIRERVRTPKSRSDDSQDGS